MGGISLPHLSSWSAALNTPAQGLFIILGDMQGLPGQPPASEATQHRLELAEHEAIH